jgi:hypothetical protein
MVTRPASFFYVVAAVGLSVLRWINSTIVDSS